MLTVDHMHLQAYVFLWRAYIAKCFFRDELYLHGCLCNLLQQPPQMHAQHHHPHATLISPQTSAVPVVPSQLCTTLRFVLCLNQVMLNQVMLSSGHEVWQMSCLSDTLKWGSTHHMMQLSVHDHIFLLLSLFICYHTHLANLCTWPFS